MMFIPITLLALTGGMFLLAKTNKDNLGLWYKIVSWFIIVASVISLACGAMHYMMKFYGKAYMHKGMMMHEKSMKDGMWHMNMRSPHEFMDEHFDGYGSREGRRGEMYRDGMCKGMCQGMCQGGMYKGGMCDEEMCKEDRGEYYWKKCYDELKDSCSKKGMVKK